MANVSGSASSVRPAELGVSGSASSVHYCDQCLASLDDLGDWLEHCRSEVHRCRMEERNEFISKLFVKADGIFGCAR